MGKRRINPRAKIVYGAPHWEQAKRRKKLDQMLDELTKELEPPSSFTREQVSKFIEVLRDLDSAMRRTALSQTKYGLAMLDQIARGEEPCLGLLQDDDLSNLDDSASALREAKRVTFHDDPPCERRLINGYCPDCQLHPDTQSKAIYYYCPDCNQRLKDMVCPNCAEHFQR